MVSVAVLLVGVALNNALFRHSQGFFPSFGGGTCLRFVVALFKTLGK